MNLARYLGPKGLPNNLRVENSIIGIKYVQLVNAEIKKYEDFIRPSFSQVSEKSNGTVFFVNQTTISLLWDTKSFFLLTENYLIDYETRLCQIQYTMVEIERKLSQPEVHQEMQKRWEKWTSEIASPAHEKYLDDRKNKYHENKGTLVHNKLLNKLCQKCADERSTAQHQLMLQKLQEKYENNKDTPEHKEMLKNLKAKHANITGTPKHAELLEK